MIVRIARAKVGHRQAPFNANSPAFAPGCLHSVADSQTVAIMPIMPVDPRTVHGRRAGAGQARATSFRTVERNRPGKASCPDALYPLRLVTGTQLCGSNSPMRLADWVGSLSRTSFRYR